MRTALKFAVTGLFAAGLLGAGAGVANVAPATTAGGPKSYDECVDEQTALGLINLDLNLLTQCIAYDD